MSNRTSSTYDWLRLLPRSVLELDAVPLFGHTPPFPFDALAAVISKELNLEGLKIENTESQWLEKDQLLDNLGDELVPLNIGLTGTKGSACWVMPRDHLRFITSKLLNSNEEEIVEEYEEGFYRFLGYQVINAMGTLDWDKSASFHILNSKETPSTASFCLDIRASWKEHVLLGRLIISPALQQAWKEKFNNRTLQIPELKAPFSETIETTVRIEAGKTAFSLDEWKKIKLGDFILIESCGLKEGGHSLVSLSIKGEPLFKGELADGKLTIKERSEYQEVKAIMADNDESEIEEEFEDFDEEEEEDEETFEEEEEELEELQEEEQAVAEEPKVAEQLAAAPVEKLVTEKALPTAPTDIPLSVVVEVGRLKMSFQKLMDLQPGNVLDLNIKPEDGVDLTINGRRVAKAELLRVGDTLGLRILDIS